ncbi:MAG: hypothetical protein CMG07_01600 [Candidatus Marinimicrobia bacterium]|nr:hypothetical protein [Candidatus Neomarinimicrobiota bacterium]
MITKVLIKKLNKLVVYLLLTAFLLIFPTSNYFLCIESNGDMSFENATFKSCKISDLSVTSVSSEVDQHHASEHEVCVDCTDVSISQTFSTKSNSETERTVGIDNITAPSLSSNIYVDTKPIEIISDPPGLAYNQLHKYFKSIILII